MGFISAFRGAQFERHFAAVCREAGVGAVRLPECGGKWIGPGRQKAVSIICDYILACRGQVVLCDVKSVAAKTFPYSQLRDKTTFNQMRAMLKLIIDSRSHELMCGFVVFFHPPQGGGRCVFFSAAEAWNVEPRGSLKMDEKGSGISLGPALRPHIRKLFGGPHDSKKALPGAAQP